MRQIPSRKARKKWSQAAIISQQLMEYMDAAHTGSRCFRSSDTWAHLDVGTTALSLLHGWSLTQNKCDIGNAIKCFKSGAEYRATEVILCSLPYLHHTYFLQTVLILALSPAPFLAVTATVELHSGGQPRLPDCLAGMLLGELYLAPFFFGGTRMLFKMLQYCIFREGIPAWHLNSSS